MTPQEMVLLVLKISLGLSIFSVGLKASFGDASYAFRRPAKLLRALLSMYVLVPAFAITLCLAFDLKPAVKIALVFLAIAPIPPILPRKALKSGGRGNYAIGLLVATALLVIVLIPNVMGLFERLFGIALHMSAPAIATLVFGSLLIPLMLGVAIHAVAPAIAERMASPVAIAATILVFLAFLPVLFALRMSFLALIGDGTLLALAAFALFGLLAGHLLGGPPAEDRTVLALYSSSRHPAIAIAMAQENFPEHSPAVAAIVMGLLVSVVMSAAYLAWIEERKPRPAHAASHG